MAKTWPCYPKVEQTFSYKNREVGSPNADYGDKQLQMMVLKERQLLECKRIPLVIAEYLMLLFFFFVDVLIHYYLLVFDLKNATEPRFYMLNTLI